MKLIGIVDTMFARYDMSIDVRKVLDQYPGLIAYERYTVPGIKDLPVAALKMFNERGCDLVIALGMPGPTQKDKASTQVASNGLVNCQLMVGKHILEVFVHEDEGRDERELKRIMQDRAAKHAQNAVDLLLNPEKLTSRAGQGVRQGFPDAGPLR